MLRIGLTSCYNTMTRNCVYCNDIIYQEDEGIVCSRCKPHKQLAVKPEIYASEDYKDQKSFSELYFGNINYRTMRQKNIDRHN